MVPRAYGPGFFGLQVEGSNRSASQLAKLDGAELGFVDGAARAVGGEDGGGIFVEDASQCEEAFAASARTGAADGAEAEALKSAGDEFAVEALADEDRG